LVDKIFCGIDQPFTHGHGHDERLTGSGTTTDGKRVSIIIVTATEMIDDQLAAWTGTPFK
jgi:hypothetical protein